MPKNTYCNL